MFKVEITEHTALKLNGIFVRTNMQNSQTDCPALWGEFMPMLKTMPAQSYGISVTVDSQKGIFDYWAAAQVPEQPGFKEINIPASTYAKCIVPNLRDLQTCYKYMYAVWPEETRDWQLDFTAPCFELYDNRYAETGEFDLYIPIKKREK